MGKFDKHNRPLQKMFLSVPGRYDLMNRILTFRMDEVWRKKAAKIIIEMKPALFLDLCCGTGDLIFRIVRDLGSVSDSYGLDFSLPMLAKAQDKLAKINCNENLILADAMKMPFPDDTFDLVGISFAFRNLTWRNPNSTLFLSEIRRIIMPGGTFLIIESSQPESAIVKYLFNLYLKIVMSRIGGFLSGHKAAYSYLARSASQFYTPEELQEVLINAGFSSIQDEPLFFGASAITIAQ